MNDEVFCMSSGDVTMKIDIHGNVMLIMSNSGGVCNMTNEEFDLIVTMYTNWQAYSARLPYALPQRIASHPAGNAGRDFLP